MKPLTATTLTLIGTVLILVCPDASAWNIPGHMLSGVIAYQILQRESPDTIPVIRSILEKNPWYETHWKAQLEKQSESDRYEMLFMFAARWADDIRTKDRSLSHHTAWQRPPCSPSPCAYFTRKRTS